MNFRVFLFWVECRSAGTTTSKLLVCGCGGSHRSFVFLCSWLDQHNIEEMTGWLCDIPTAQVVELDGTSPIRFAETDRAGVSIKNNVLDWRINLSPMHECPHASFG